jgi:hypothetical protein
VSKKRKKSSKKGTTRRSSRRTTATPALDPSKIEAPDPDHWVWPVLDTLPQLPAGLPRKLFVAGLPNWALSGFREKGYQLVDVRTMDPETNPQAYIDGWLQGMAEGTIEKNSERRRTLELMAKTNGLLIRREIRLDAKAEITGRSLELILDRFGSKKTLKPVTAKQLKTAQKQAIIPGYQGDDDG